MMAPPREAPQPVRTRAQRRCCTEQAAAAGFICLMRAMGASMSGARPLAQDQLQEQNHDCSIVLLGGGT
jgi:hypothetical protein